MKVREEVEFWRQSEKVSRQCLRALLQEKLFFGVEGAGPDGEPSQEQENEHVKGCLDLLDQNEKLSTELNAMSNEGKLLRLIAARAQSISTRHAAVQRGAAEGKDGATAEKSPRSGSLHSSTARSTSRKQAAELEMWNTLKKSHDRIALLESTIETLQQRADDRNSSLSSDRALEASERSLYPVLVSAAPLAEDAELTSRIRRLELIVHNLEKNPQQRLDAHQHVGHAERAQERKEGILRTLASASKSTTANLVERILKVEERLSSR
eukprot:761596-Hanusia_phi.AAC.8